MDSHLIDIRRLTDIDAQAFSILRKDANADQYYRGNREPERDLTQEESRRLIGHANTIILGAFDNSELIGMVSLGWMVDDFTLFGLFVSDRCRRSGIGEGLIQSLIKELKGMRAKTIKLEVTRENKSAIALYEKMGFSYLRRSYDSLKLVLVIDQQRSEV